MFREISPEAWQSSDADSAAFWARMMSSEQQLVDLPQLLHLGKLIILARTILIDSLRPPTTTPAPPKTEGAPPAQAATATSPPKSSASTKPALVSFRPKSAATPAENAKIQEERVKAMFAKYNMTLEVGEWTQPFNADIPRVEKKVRMRVHRTCHRCQTQYGVDKACSNWNHKRCKKCPRYTGPKKMT